MKVSILSRETTEIRVVDVDVTSVVLVATPDNRLKMFFCPNCQNPVVQYNGQVVQILPGAVPTDIPILVQCSNRNCRTKYLFERIAVRDDIMGI
jgi:hypothetical protein